MSNEITKQHVDVKHSDKMNDNTVKEPFSINLIANRYLVYDVKGKYNR